MKQTFEIEHEGRRYDYFQVSYALDMAFGRTHTVTEITEPEKCVWTDEGAFVKVGCGREPICSCVTDFIRCPEEPINFCPYCGKPIEVRDGR